MSELEIFNNEEFGQVRSVEVEGEPYFVAKDIAIALGYSNPRKAIIDHVDEEDKGVTKCDTLGGAQFENLSYLQSCFLHIVRMQDYLLLEKL